MNEIETLTMAVSIASLILAVVAIILSFKFYEMSSRASDEIKNATRDITASVGKLEVIFGLLYRDTFSMMKDTLRDITKHAFPEADLETKLFEKRQEEAEVKIDKMKEDILEKVYFSISELAEKTEITSAAVEGIKRTMKEYLDEAVSETRVVEKSTSSATLEDRVLLVAYDIEMNQHRSALIGDILGSFVSKGEVLPPGVLLGIIDQLIIDKNLSRELAHGRLYYDLTPEGRRRVEELLENK